MIELFRKAAKMQEHIDKLNKGKIIGIGFYGSTRENEGKPLQGSKDTK